MVQDKEFFDPIQPRVCLALLLRILPMTQRRRKITRPNLVIFSENAICGNSPEFKVNSLSSTQSGNSLITSAFSSKNNLLRKVGKSEILGVEQETIIAT